MAWLSGCVYWKVDGRERRLLWLRCVMLEALLCVELLVAKDMSDHAMFLNYVIPSKWLSWSRKQICSRLTGI
jgi:hypothetical protein